MEALTPMNTMTKWLFQGMIERNVFIVDMRKRTARGIWKSPKRGEKVVD